MPVDKKILVAGNPEYGIAQAIGKRWPHCQFASRSNGFDLCDEQSRQAFAEKSLNYDVVICCSALWRFQQTLVLELVWKLWEQKGKQGQIICLGSTADLGVRSSNWLYPVEKKALKALSRNLSLCAQRGNGIKVSYLSLGYVDTPKTQTKHPAKNKLGQSYAVDLIEWVLGQPAGINVNEISVDPIQNPPEMVHQ